MANVDSKPSTTVHPNKTSHTASYETLFKTLEGKLTTIEHDLHKVLACYHFLSDATRTVITHSETPLPDAHHPWHLGMYLLHEWMEEASQAAIEEIKHINQWTAQQANVLQQGKGHEKN